MRITVCGHPKECSSETARKVLFGFERFVLEVLGTYAQELVSTCESSARRAAALGDTRPTMQILEATGVLPRLPPSVRRHTRRR